MFICLSADGAKNISWTWYLCLEDGTVWLWYYLVNLCKKVYSTLTVNIQRFLSAKIKNIQMYHVSECYFDNYQFLQLITFLGEIIELYLCEGNFLENIMSALNKETKNKASVLKIDLSYYFHTSPRGIFRSLSNIWVILWFW